MQLARPNPWRAFADLHKSNPAAIDKPTKLPQRNPQHPSRFSEIQQRLDRASFARVPLRFRFFRRACTRPDFVAVRLARTNPTRARRTTVRWCHIFSAGIITSHHAAQFELRYARVHDAAKCRARGFAFNRARLPSLVETVSPFLGRSLRASASFFAHPR